MTNGFAFSCWVHTLDAVHVLSLRIKSFKCGHPKSDRGAFVFFSYFTVHYSAQGVS